MSKPTHNLSRQRSKDREVASDTELDSILEEVEKIEENKLKVERKSDARKSAENKFTKKDKQTLKEIFNSVERRKKEFKELNLGASSSVDGVRRNSVSSKSSRDSDSQSDDLSSSDNSSSENESSNDDRSTDDEQSVRLYKKHTKKALKYPRESSSKAVAKINDVKRGKAPRNIDKTNEPVKLQKKKSKNKPQSNRKSDEEELDSMVNELLEC